jgi:hypothetical protein
MNCTCRTFEHDSPGSRDRAGDHLPFILGEIPSDTMAMVFTAQDPEGAALPELVRWLPVAALDEPIGNIGDAALSDTTRIITALVS